MVDAASSTKADIVRGIRACRFYVYLLPTFVLLGVFCFYPPILGFLGSFYEWNGANVKIWNGLDNFAKMAHDKVLIASIGNLIKLATFTLITSITVPLLAAELIFNLRSLRAKYWYRVLLVAPMVVPGMVTLLLWQFIYDPNVGLLNAVLGVFNVPAQRWLNDPHLALYCLMFMAFPFVGGITVLIYLAGLNSIGQEVFDAAKIDGARFWQRFFRIDVPLVMGQIKLLLILSIIGVLKGYGAQLILTDGGPGYSTMVPGLHMYHQAFEFDHLGYACALGLALFLVIITLTYLSMKIRKPETE